MTTTQQNPGQETTSRWIGLAGVSVASFIGCIDFTIVNTAIPDIQAGLHATVGAAQWIISGFVMALSSFMVVTGRLADLYGRRRALYIAIFIFGIASLGAGASVTIGQMIACRFIQGASVAALYTASAAIVANAFADNERGKAMGILFAGNGFGLALGPVAGGVLIGALGWRWVFLINIPFLLLSLLLCRGRLRESLNTEDRAAIDWLGLVLLVAGLSLLLLGITKAVDWGWTSGATLGAIGGGVALLVLFLIAELRSAAPLLQVHLFTNARFVIASIATAGLAFFYCSAFFLMPLYLTTVRGNGSFAVGFLLLPTTAMVAIISPVAGRLVDRIGPLPLMLAGLALLAGSAALQSLFSDRSGLPFVILAFAVMGLGWGCILGPSSVAALASVPERLGGVAMGASWTLHNVGGALGLTLATVVYRLRASAALQEQAAPTLTIAPAQADQWVSEPEHALDSLAHAGVEPSLARTLAAQSFLAGYSAAMVLLVFVTLAGLAAIALLMLNAGPSRGRAIEAPTPPAM